MIEIRQIRYPFQNRQLHKKLASALRAMSKAWQVHRDWQSSIKKNNQQRGMGIMLKILLFFLYCMNLNKMIYLEILTVI